jgi:hypothetical protein
MVMREHLWIPVILTNGCILTVVEVIPLQAEYAVAPFGSPLPLLRFFSGGYDHDFGTCAVERRESVLS